MRVVKELPFAPPGTHKGRLAAIDEVDGRFGRKAVQVVFHTADGYQVKHVVGIVAAEDTSLGRLVDDLAGREIPVGDEVDLDDYVGKEYEVTVEKSVDGPTRVTKIKKVED